MKLKLVIIILLQIFLISCSDMTDWQVYNDAGWEKNENEQYKEAIKLYKIAYEKIHFGFFIDKEGLATLTTNMAASYRGLGDYETAAKYYLESLLAWENLVGKEHENYAIICNNYSLFLEGQYKYDEALKYATRALKIRRKLFGEQSEEVAVSHRGIAGIYLNIEKPDKAMEHARSAQASALSAQGKNSELYAGSELSLGRVYRVLGETGNAMAHISNAIKIYESVAKNSTNAADTINELAFLQQNSGEYLLANDSFHKALEKYLKIYDKNHPYIAIMYKNLAFNYLDWGQDSEALKAIQESVKISSAVYGVEHHFTKKVSKICNQVAEKNQSSTKLCSG